MSVSFIITTTRPGANEHTSFKIERDEFVNALRNQWPNVDFRQSDLFSDGAVWRLLPERALASFGYLGNGGKVVILDPAPPEAFEHFILWYRKFVPEDVPLYLFISCDALDTLPITSDTTAEEIVKFTGLRR